MPSEQNRDGKRKQVYNMDQFLIRSINVLKTFLDKRATSFNNTQLVDLHRKTHMLYAGNSKRSNPNKKFLDLLVKKHDEIVKEMLKREKRHNSPLP